MKARIGDCEVEYLSRHCPTRAEAEQVATTFRAEGYVVTVERSEWADLWVATGRKETPVGAQGE